MTDSIARLQRHIARLKPDWDIDALSGFLYLEGGYSNDNYRFSYAGERYVLRVPFQPRPDVDRHLERRIYDNSARIGAPALVAFDPADGSLISRWVPGTLLADSTVDPDHLVDYLTALHQRLPEIERDYDPVAQARRHLERANAPGWLEKRAAALHWQPVQSATCHNDLNPWNVIRAPGGDWVTLDWEWVGRNDPLFDLVALHDGSAREGASFDAATLEAMARRYLGAPAPDARLRDCLTAFWLRETTWALAEIAGGNDRPEIVEQRDLGLSRLEALS